MDKREGFERRAAEVLGDEAAGLTIDEQRKLALRLATHVFVTLEEDEREDFLHELTEALTLGRAGENVPGNSNPGAWETPVGE